MVFQPNYRFKKAQRQRVKQTRKDEQPAGTSDTPTATPTEAAASRETEATKSQEQPAGE